MRADRSAGWDDLLPAGRLTFTHWLRPAHAPHGTRIHSGQTLRIRAGVGRVQTEGGPIEEVRPGDVVWFPPGEKETGTALRPTPDDAHRGAGISHGKNVDWMEKISDAQDQR